MEISLVGLIDKSRDILQMLDGYIGNYARLHLDAVTAGWHLNADTYWSLVLDHLGPSGLTSAGVEQQTWTLEATVTQIQY